jgi:hypothetical protein
MHVQICTVYQKALPQGGEQQEHMVSIEGLGVVYGSGVTSGTMQRPVHLTHLVLAATVVCLNATPQSHDGPRHDAMQLRVVDIALRQWEHGKRLGWAAL